MSTWIDITPASWKEPVEISINLEQIKPITVQGNLIKFSNCEGITFKPMYEQFFKDEGFMKCLKETMDEYFRDYFAGKINTPTELLTQIDKAASLQIKDNHDR